MALLKNEAINKHVLLLRFNDIQMESETETLACHL